MRRLFMLLVLASMVVGCKGGSVEMPTGSPTLAAVKPEEAQVIGMPQPTAAPAATPSAPN